MTASVAQDSLLLIVATRLLQVVLSRSRGALMRPRDEIVLPSSTQRARGMPGAGRTHGPPAEKNAGGRYHRFSRGIPAFPARWFSRLLRVLPGAPGLLATVICASA